MAKKKTDKQVLTLATLKKQGAFVGPPVEKEISWKYDKEKYSGIVYIRQASCATFEKEVAGLVSRRDAVATRIAAMVCQNAEGKPLLTYEDAVALNEPLTNALLGAINEVNGEGKK